MPAFVGPEINDDGIVALYDSANPKSWGLDGSKWKDASKNSNDGSITGSIHSQGPFPGAGYVSFDGTNDYLNCGSNSDFVFGTGEFTVEAWVYSNGSQTSNACALSFGTSGTVTNTWQFDANNPNSSNKWYFQLGNQHSTSVESTNNVAHNQWIHIAASRDSNNVVRLFIDGVLNDTATITNNLNATGPLKIGVNRATSAYFDGYISNARVIKGTCLYTTTFTPPTAPLTPVANTKLLTCQGGSIVDASPAGHSITNNGATAVYNDISYFTFDGTDDYISSNAVLPAGQQQYTISTWWKTADAIETQVIWEQNVSGTAVQHKRAAMVINNTYCGFSGHSNDALYLVNITANTWINVVMVVDITRQYAIYMYKNGSLDAVANPNNGASNLDVGTGGASIGKTVVTNLLSDGYFNGQISNVTIYNRALTSTEVAKNFNALRGRYGI